MTENQYHPETYWTEVGRRIEERENGKNLIAGDDEPYYRYKRKMFLKLLRDVPFVSQSVLEIGHGPGGNLLEVWSMKPSRLTGVDISEQMLKLASNKVPKEIELIKINGTTLPFRDKEFSIAFTATVLQHNTDEVMLSHLVKEIARVSAKKVYFFERVESTIKGDDLCLGRPVDYYAKMMNDAGFRLKSKKFINIRISYLVNGAWRKLLNRRDRKEGEPVSKLCHFMQTISLPVTSVLDKIFPSQTDICRMEFERT